MAYEEPLGQLEVYVLSLLANRRPIKSHSLMGQEQTCIKDWALILGLSSRPGSTFLFPILCPRGRPCRPHRPGAPGQPPTGGHCKRWKGQGMGSRRAAVLSLLPPCILATGLSPLSLAQVLVPEHPLLVPLMPPTPL